MLLNKKQAENLLNEYLEEHNPLFSNKNLKAFSPQKDSWGVYIQGNSLGAANSFCGLAFKEDIVFFKIWYDSDFIENRVEFIKHIKKKKDLLIEYTDKNGVQKKSLSNFTNWEKLKRSDYCQINSEKYQTKEQAKEILTKIFPLFIDFTSWQRKKNIRSNLLIPVDSKEDIIKNMENTESLFQNRDCYLRDLIVQGHNYIYYKFNGEDRFLPSRYVGYKNISVKAHNNANNLNGSETDRALDLRLGKKEPSPKFRNLLNAFIQNMYGDEYSSNNHKHSFWATNISFYAENESSKSIQSIKQLQEDLYKKAEEINSKRHGTPPDFSHYGKTKKKRVQVTRSVLYRDRDPQVVADALWLAKGVCQGCGADKNSLFERASDGTVYLEVHHIIPLSDKKGFDTLDNVCALCPICHRLMHYGKETDKEKIRRNIDKTMKEREKLIKQILDKQYDS